MEMISKTLTLRLSECEYELLNALAARHGVSPTKLLTIAVKSHMFDLAMQGPVKFNGIQHYPKYGNQPWDGYLVTLDEMGIDPDWAMKGGCYTADFLERYRSVQNVILGAGSDRKEEDPQEWLDRLVMNLEGDRNVVHEDGPCDRNLVFLLVHRALGRPLDAPTMIEAAIKVEKQHCSHVADFMERLREIEAGCEFEFDELGIDTFSWLDFVEKAIDAAPNSNRLGVWLQGELQ